MTTVEVRLQREAILSRYVHPVYDALVVAGWERKDFQTVCTVVGQTRIGKKIPREAMKRVESVWVSPEHIERGCYEPLMPRVGGGS